MSVHVSERSVRRLSLYRRFLLHAQAGGSRYLFSHDIATATRTSAAQVRRDLMAISGSGSSSRGYHVADLLKSVSDFLDAPAPQHVALIGLGNLGRAVFAYFVGRHPNLRITLTFDIDPAKTGRLINGCPCHNIHELSDLCPDKGIRMAILTVPAAEAQTVTDMLVRGGIRGIVNFAPVTLYVPVGVFVETMDFSISLETAAFFSRA